jgi:hypothetical protein
VPNAKRSQGGNSLRPFQQSTYASPACDCRLSFVRLTHGEQEMSVWNGHYECTCYHPLFLFNQFGDLERCALRPGNVYSADGWRDVLDPVIARYRGKVSRLYFRADAGFANPDVNDFLEAERIKYAIRLPANRILQDRIGYLLKRPVGRPPHEVRRYYANFRYQAASWKTPRRVVAKVEWHPGELYPRVGFIVTNLSRPPENIVAFYNQRGTCEQWIKEGKGAIRWTRLSCRLFSANPVRLQLHALAYNLGNFLRTLATPEPIKDWSLTSLKEKLIKIGAKSSVMAAMSPSRWRKLRFPDTSSPTSCGSSPDCGHRLIQKRREWFGCHAFKRKPRESYALIKKKTTIIARIGLVSPTLKHRRPQSESPVLPMTPVCAIIELNKVVIWWMSLISFHP